MSEDSRKTEGAKGSGDAPQRKRRRRRRRRPDGASKGRQRSDRPAKTGESTAGEARDGDRSRRPRGDAEASSDTRRRGRRRSRRPRGDRDIGDGGRPRRSGPPRSDGAKQPARTADSSAPAAASSATLSALAASVGVAASELDQGWDDASEPSAPTATKRRGGAHRTNRDEGQRSEERQRYGDDSDVPTPEIAALTADMPVEIADPDPVTANFRGPDGDMGADSRAPLRNVVGIKYTGPGKIMLCDAGERSLRVGDRVMVESDAGPRLATIAVASLRRPHSSHRGGRLKRVLRRPDKSDLRTVERLETREQNALRQAKQTVRARAIPMRVFRAEMAHNGKKVRLYFSAEGRVDSRGITRELSRSLNMRVEMRQTGVRDQARMIGGIGACGQELCCTTWLPEFVPVSIKHAKDQGLVLNPTKVSGQCGRLKCCLVYEQAIYAEMRKGLPKLGKRVITAVGEGRVVEVDVLRQRIRVSHVTGDVSVFTKDEVKPMFPSQAQPRANTKTTKSGERKRRGSKRAAEEIPAGASADVSELPTVKTSPAAAAPGDAASTPVPEFSHSKTPAAPTAEQSEAASQSEPAEASSSTEDN